MSYDTNLKDWGATGNEYPTGYSYEDGEPPVDHWDNFLIYNVIEDIKHLIDKTNEDLLRREGGELLSNLDVGEHRLLGEAGHIDFSNAEISIEGDTRVLQSLRIGGDIKGPYIDNIEDNIEQAEINANSYTDSEISNTETYADNSASEAESNSNSYTDSNIKSHKENEVHDQKQPPQEHGPEAHNDDVSESITPENWGGPTILIDGEPAGTDDVLDFESK